MITPELTIIVPTYNEQENITVLVGKLTHTLEGFDWEVLFVDDDSPDGTFATVEKLGKTNNRVRGLLRTENRGLSLACIDGIKASNAPFVAIMDADLQHDETILPELLEAVKIDGAEIAVGSRYKAGGGTGDWSASRIIKSRLATWISHLVVPAGLNDPMSGFFLMRRSVFDEVQEKLSGRGFKILMDIFASSERDLKFVEIPYTFRVRQHGMSKLDNSVVWEFLALIIEKSPSLQQAVKLSPWALAIGAIALFHYLA